MSAVLVPSRKVTVKKPTKPAWVAVDTETTGLDVWLKASAFAVGMFDPTDDGTLTYFEWRVNPLTREVYYNPTEIDELRKVLEDPDIAKVFHNAKFDLQMIAKMGIEVKGRVEDTSFASRVCDTQEMSYALKPLAAKYCGFPLDDEKELKDVVRKCRLVAKKKGWAIHSETAADYWIVQHAKTLGVSLERDDYCETYCQGDVIRTAVLWNMYSDILDSDPLYRQTYERELVLLRIVMEMEARGMSLSRRRTLHELKQSQTKAEKYLAQIRQYVEDPSFNPNSPKQLIKILYGPTSEGGLGLKVLKRAAGGSPSTDWMALREHADNDFVRMLTAYRSNDKAIDTFFQKYADMMRPCPISNPDGSGDTHVLHPSLNQCGTVTGRFSCNNPNLQQVANSNTSARGSDPIQARAPFGPRPGYVWYPADFAQMELRVFADLADVPSMLEAIFAGRDLNTENANRAWGGKGNPYALEAAAYSLELGHYQPSKPEVMKAWDLIGWDDAKARHGVRSTLALQTAEDWLAAYDYDIVRAEKSLDKSGTRGRSKIVTFAKIYGGGPSAVVDLLYCTFEEAQAYWKQYDRAFPEIRDYIKSRSRRAELDGYIVTRYGRKSRIDPNFSYRAVNYEVQGTCADLMKEGIRKVSDYFKKTALDAHLIIPIHDELIPEIRIGHDYRWLLRETCRLMSDHEGRLRVPMPVEMKKVREQWSLVEKGWEL